MKSIDRDRFGLLLREAHIKSRLVKELRFVPEEINDWHDRDFIAITNRGHTAGVLVYPEMERIIPFTLQRRKSNTSGRIEPIICDICATWRRGTESAMITFTKERSSVTFLCCDDLLCSLHVRDRTEAAALSRTQLREDSSLSTRVDRLNERLRSLLDSVGSS